MKNLIFLSFVLTTGLFLGACQAPDSNASKSRETKAGPGVSENVPFAELEEVLGEKALAWVRDQNRESLARLGSDATYTDLKADILKIIQAKDRIPGISIRGTNVYNFWQDEKNEKGIYRVQSLADFRRKSDTWTTLIDVDAISKAEKESWVFKGLHCAPVNQDRCLVMLSRGGGDAVVAREYDLQAKAFVAGGISLPEAKMDVDWYDDDTLWIAAPNGPGTVSTSGYAVTVRLWHRGDDLAKLPTLFKGDVTDVAVSAGTYRAYVGGVLHSVEMLTRAVSFFQNETYVSMTEKPGERWEKLPLPLESTIEGLSQGVMLFTVKKDATVFDSALKTGALYAFDIEAWRKGQPVQVETVFEPNLKQAFSGVSVTRDGALISYLDQVQGRLANIARHPARAKSSTATWTMKPVTLPGSKGVVSIGSTDYRESLFTVYYTDFLTPSQMYLGGDGQARGGRAALLKLRDTPARFDSTGMKVAAFVAKSKDGTGVPYFLVTPKGMSRTSGKTPTLISAYGGFEVPETPYYLGTLGKVWVERGGAYVLANIRGGGEFGPRWHQAALREKRQNAFDDLYAVAEDVIHRGFTSAAHLGVRGGSNGGLLTGVALTQRPDLFAAIVCQVPLLDMLRYHELLAGASWMEEYGNPDIAEDRAWIEKYSPFQNLRAGMKYPEPFFNTSTRDDRVHPGHARRMVARMKELGYPVLYFENTEGGHAGAATLDSRAAMSALEYRYLWDKLR